MVQTPFVGGCLCLFLLLTASGLAAEDANPLEPAATDRTGEPIESGFVIRKGEFVPPPYTVSQSGAQILLNREPLLRLDDTAEDDPERPFRRRHREYPLAAIEKQLYLDMLLIESHSGVLHSIDPETGWRMIEILCSDLPRTARIQKLMRIQSQPFDSAEWGRIVDRFVPNDDLAQRVADLQANMLDVEEEIPLDGVTVIDRYSRGFTYGLTVVGMLLAVASFGTVLMFRPEAGQHWTLEDQSSQATTLVRRCVVMIGLLSLFDLVCTLVAHFAGGFIEVNPIADSLLSKPAALAAFKVLLTVFAAAILLKLQRYYGTQVASWWICLLLTLLTCRWIAVESLLLA